MVELEWRGVMSMAALSTALRQLTVLGRRSRGCQRCAGEQGQTGHTILHYITPMKLCL